MAARLNCLPALLAAVFGVGAITATAQTYPVKPIRVVVPFPPGGATDALARPITDRLSARWKVPVVLENKPGANNQIAVDRLMNSPPDGHTLLFATTTAGIAPIINADAGYRFEDIDILMPQKFSYFLLASIPISLITFVAAFGGWLRRYFQRGTNPALVLLCSLYCATCHKLFPYPDDLQLARIADWFELE